MKKLRIALLIIVLLISSETCAFANTEKSNSLSPKKIVSMIYDDSGSMHLNSNTNWSYANYALQIFTGLMNSDDELMITFMSDPNTQIKSNADSGLLKSFSGNRQQTVNEIRDYKSNGDTPFDAIDSAGKALQSVKDDSSATQYWLVVITDGAFEKIPGNDSSHASKEELNSKLAKYAGKIMPNGSECNVIFLSIGKTSDYSPSETENIIVRQADGTQIVQVMSEMADTITGRYRVQTEDISIDNNRIELSSDVPLLNIQILTQNTKAKVKSVEGSDSGSMNNTYIDMSTPKGDSQRKVGKNLFGSLITITPKEKYISPDKYSITFNEKISPEDVVVMYEVALETNLIITRNGKIIKDTSTLRENETIDIDASLRIIGTNEIFDVNKIPKNLYESLTLTIDEDGNRAVSKHLKKGKKTLTYENYIIKKGETVISGITKLSGFAPLVTRERFIANNPVEYDIKADDDEVILRQGKINGKKNSVDFTITGDGKVLSKKDIESLIDKDSISITHNNKKTGIKFRYEVSEDGKLKVYPKTSILNNAVAFFNIPTGEYDVTASISESKNDTGHFIVKAYSVIAIVTSLIILGLILLLLYLLTKPHFPNGKLQSDKYSFDSRGININHDGHRELEIGFWTSFFTLKGARRVKHDGLILEAGKDGKMYVTPEWIRGKQNIEKRRDHFIFFDKPMEDTSRERAIKNAYNDLKANVEFTPNTKNRLFDKNKILLSIVTKGNLATYQFKSKKRRK